MSFDLVAAIASCSTGVVQVPPGEWTIPDGVQCNCRIEGAGAGLCRFSAGSIVFGPNGSMARVGMDGIGEIGVSGCTFTRATSRILDDCEVSGYDTNVLVQSGSGWSARFKSLNFKSFGMVIENTSNPDEGDWTLDCGTVFDEGQNQSIACVHHLSSGGAKFIGVKFLGSEWGVLGEINGNTSDFIMDACSLENQRITKVAYRPNGGSFRNVIVSACQGMGPSSDFHFDNIGFVVITGNLDTSADNKPSVTQGPSVVADNLNQQG